jgi:2,3-bisphosphoglycerate-dependent phosphoglycerate mutase
VRTTAPPSPRAARAQVYRPVYKSWRLNERSFGALTGLSEDQIGASLGAAAVQRYKQSLTARPPPITPDHPLAPHRERKYGDLPFDALPMSESLQDCLDRCLPLWHEKIAVDLKAPNARDDV